MTDLIKPYLNLIGGVLLATAIAYSHFKAYEAGKARVQVKFDLYKENIHAQKERNAIEKARVEAEQNARYAMAQTGYGGALDELNRRLRDAEALSGRSCVLVAGSGGNAVPGKAEDPAHPVTALAVGRGICDSDFYAKAMREHVQCKYLLELVR